MIKRRAECACGQLSAVCLGEPVRVSVCHCLACKRRTGSAFSYNARYAPENVAVAGQAKQHTRVSDAGSSVTNSFCPDCGTIVFYHIDTDPLLVAIPAGTFADVDFPEPYLSFYHATRRCNWVEINTEHLDKIG